MHHLAAVKAKIFIDAQGVRGVLLELAAFGDPRGGLVAGGLLYRYVTASYS